MPPKPVMEYAAWTTDDITALLEYLTAHKSKGVSGGFRKATWTAAAAHINRVLTCGAPKMGDGCKGKFQIVSHFFLHFWALSKLFCLFQLEKMYEVVKTIWDNSGWSWDDEKGADSTPEKKGTWVNYVAKHPLAQPFHNAGWVYLDAFDGLGSSLARGGHIFWASQGVSTAQVDSGYSDVLALIHVAQGWTWKCETCEKRIKCLRKNPKQLTLTHSHYTHTTTILVWEFWASNIEKYHLCL